LAPSKKRSKLPTASRGNARSARERRIKDTGEVSWNERPDDAGQLSAIAQQDQGRPHPDPEGAAERAPGTIFDPQVVDPDLAGKPRGYRGLGGPAVPTPAGAELEQQQARSRVELSA
jgi:hypothetical protein